MPKGNSYGLPFVLYRGGTSKALFIHEDVLPPPGSQRDRLLKRVMGSPDPLQLDGMGGSRAVTSKIAIIKKSDREGIDVDYTFVQVGVADDTISYAGNCGNISSAVGPFAIDQDLVAFRPSNAFGPGRISQEVRIYNTGTKKKLVSHVPIDESGCFVSRGEQGIAGVPGTASPILMDYRSSIGAILSRGILPTGRSTDTVNVDGQDLEVTICDAGNLCVFANARDFGITGFESAAELTANQDWIKKCQELRGKTAVLLSLTDNWTTWDSISPFGPLPIFIAPPQDPSKGHVSARLFLDKMCHESMAGTGAISSAACSRVTGTIINKAIGKAAGLDSLDIVHPIGVMGVRVQKEETLGPDGLPVFRTLSFVRTARRIMEGTAYVPDDFAPPSPVDNLNKEIPPVTRILAEFVQRMEYDQLDSEINTTLKNLVIDYIGVSAAATRKAESTGPVAKAISRLTGAGGSYTVIGKGQGFSAQYAALLNGFLGHSLDFDDTYADGSLHAGVTTIAAGLVAAEHASVSSEAVLTALAVGYEITCRLGRALGQASYSRGFHNTATAGIFGAVSTIAKIRGLSAPKIEMAFGLAGSKAAGSMQYLENGSWNKRLHPGFAVHDALLSVELAESGVLGATKIFEGKFGFFNAYTPAKVDYEKLIHSLGSEWVFLKTIWKPFPACRMTHGLIFMADKLRTPETLSKEIKSINVHLPPYQVPIVGATTPNKIHPQNIVDAQFSAYYQVALAWLHGSHTGWAGYDRLGDPDIHNLADRITVTSDHTLLNFQQKIEFEFVDGSVLKEVIQPRPEEGAGEASSNDVIAKFLGLASPVYGEDQAKRVKDVVQNLEHHTVSELMSLIQ